MDRTQCIILRSIFNQNRATSGAALMMEDKSVLSVINSSFVANVASSVGGGVRLSGSASASMVLSTFQGNSAQFGGACAVDGSSRLSIFSLNCTTNVASTCGGVFAMNSTQPLEAGGKNVFYQNAAVAGTAESIGGSSGGALCMMLRNEGTKVCSALLNQVNFALPFDAQRHPQY
eukprot:3022317-Rhodomonas_salina.1